MFFVIFYSLIIKIIGRSQRVVGHGRWVGFRCRGESGSTVLRMLQWLPGAKTQICRPSLGHTCALRKSYGTAHASLLYDLRGGWRKSCVRLLATYEGALLPLFLATIYDCLLHARFHCLVLLKPGLVDAARCHTRTSTRPQKILRTAAY